MTITTTHKEYRSINRNIAKEILERLDDIQAKQYKNSESLFYFGNKTTTTELHVAWLCYMKEFIYQQRESALLRIINYNDEVMHDLYLMILQSFKRNKLN